MKATNKNRKYDRYEIKIIYHNGDTEEVKYKSNTDTSSYKQMLDVYTETKTKYVDNKEIAMIDFIGTSEKGDMKVLWTKEVSKYIEENMLNDLNRDCRDVVGDIITLFEVLKTQKEYYREIVGECEKRKDTLLHEILLIDNSEVEDKTLLEHNLIIKQRDNELKRKNAKNNIADLTSINKKFNINSAINILKDFSVKRDLKGCDKESPKDYKNRVEFECIYIDDKDRVRKIRKYKNQYDEMKNDPVKKKLYFYNHVGEGKKKRRKKYSK